MAFEFKLPDIGEGLTEGEITKWLVKEGQAVEADQPMVEVLTDKATVEITSPRTGTIDKILVPDGTTVPVGTVLVVIGDGSGKGGAPAKAAPSNGAKAAPAGAAHAQPAAARPQPAATTGKPTAAPAKAQPAPVSKGGMPPAPRAGDAGEAGGEEGVRVSAQTTGRDVNPGAKRDAAAAPVAKGAPASGGRAQPSAPPRSAPSPQVQEAFEDAGTEGGDVVEDRDAVPVDDSQAEVGGEEQPAAESAPVDQSRVVLAAPATRARARELGIDLRQVAATGPNGRTTRTDLETFATAPKAAPAPARAAASDTRAAAPSKPPARVAVTAPVVSEDDEHVPLKGLRGKIAAQMLRSKQNSPHFTFVDECDVTELVALREQAKKIAEDRGVKLTFLPFVIKALVAAFRRFPTVNSVVDDTKGEFVIRKQFHIGIATDTDDGLTVPVVKDADRRTILQIAAEIARLTDAARSKKIALGDLKGGTFTITSAGSIGGILATPILNYPEVGILGVYKIADRPMVRDGQIVIRKMMNLSITLDHRIVDGATAARFLNTVIEYLQQPNLLLLEGI